MVNSHIRFYSIPNWLFVGQVKEFTKFFFDVQLWFCAIWILVDKYFRCIYSLIIRCYCFDVILFDGVDKLIAKSFEFFLKSKLLNTWKYFFFLILVRDKTQDNKYLKRCWMLMILLLCQKVYVNERRRKNVCSIFNK